MSASALVRGALLGWWNITSFHVELEDTGECVDTYGVDPLGYLVITDDRMMSILTSRERTDKTPQRSSKRWPTLARAVSRMRPGSS